MTYQIGLGPTFRAGDICEVRMTPEGLAAGRDAKYPLCDYHGKPVVVIAQRGKDENGKTVVIRDTYPDNEGLVDVLLPFPFVPYKDAKEVHQVPVLPSALHPTGERLGKQSAA